MMQPLTLATPTQATRYADRLNAFAKRCGRRTDIADHLRRCAQIASGESFYSDVPPQQHERKTA